jgi:diguanylate cyclase (GGDEF)-like protein
MSTNKKLLSLIVTMLAIVSIASALIFTYNFKSYSIKMATNQAISIAQNVRDGLTSHMINGTMDKRENYLDKIKKHQNVEYFHLLRSKAVISQYGKGYEDESIISTLEKEVLKTKEIKTKLIESYDRVLLKVSIPYIATATDKPNCMQCHNAKEGDVLGALSMDIDITDIRTENLIILFKIFLTVLLITLISLYTVRRFIKPYTKLFSDLEKSISHAYKGDFSYKIETTLKNEASTISNQLNELTEIYKFKKTIENDETKNDIYNRLIHILHDKFKIENFMLFEINIRTKERKILYECTNQDEILDKDSNQCRAFRTNSDIYSSDFDDICLNCKQKTKFYMCFNFIIDEEYNLVLHIQAKSQKDLDIIKKDIPVIKNYLEMAKPVIESKILLNMLKDTTLKDPMTTLYNRRFLDELIESNISSRVKEGSQHAMLMIDIDFFKQVNDTYGHDVGDIVIKKLAEIMKKNVRDSDMPVRYGGEEFIIMLVNTTEEKTIEIAKKISEDFANEEFSTEVEVFKKTVSIGISNYPEDANTLIKSIKCADEALYVAKNTGRNKIIKFEKQEI